MTKIKNLCDANEVGEINYSITPNPNKVGYGYINRRDVGLNVSNAYLSHDETFFYINSEEGSMLEFELAEINDVVNDYDEFDDENISSIIFKDGGELVIRSRKFT